MFKNHPKGGRQAAIVLLPLLLVTACSTREDTTKVPAEHIVGNWKGPDGERISFSADREFTATGLDSKKLATADCPGGKSNGAWGFFVDDANGSHRSETAKSGSWIGLGLARKYLDWGCLLDFAVVDGGKTLCATLDPDDPCSLDVRFTRGK
ncbi:hypothetical protein SAMN04487980_105416 [Streptomyces sp. cf124]|uniref:hypothetical protein n=1 Tax=Streptomyces sp. cf124 TaxID=1761903 RepID=UPI0008E75050|nr:hypothetical protein [Streptomyces sp. cf124]SFO07132.1 hypothetical protein SAMN04487980_105416 [Streptomyces sp. cf124]